MKRHHHREQKTAETVEQQEVVLPYRAIEGKHAESDRYDDRQAQEQNRPGAEFHQGLRMRPAR